MQFKKTSSHFSNNWVFYIIGIILVASVAGVFYVRSAINANKDDCAKTPGAVFYQPNRGNAACLAPGSKIYK